ncbi:MAG: serine hydrolase [Pseudomonadota bacterium]|jgi:CubicO group peptidase (beta-lactamase class C family)|uniref:Beta-lactamase n=1 Tax=hydrothermal vent metagenome TaxID=652676 RepID=A0A160TI62_9ZZZZ
MPLFKSTAAIAIAAGLVIAPAPAAPTAPGQTGDLSGLWQAKKRFGPDIRGELTITRDGKSWRAQLAGRQATVTADGNTITFTLPNGEGSFRGSLIDDGNRIHGHWLQQRTVTSGTAYLTPVDLVAQGAGLWRGEVSPLDDSFTLFLKIDADPDGGARVFLRNPDRNIGRFLDLQHITRDGDKVTLLGKPGGAEKEVPITGGTYNADDDMLSIFISGRGATYDFKRAGDDSDFYPRPGKAPYAYRAPLARNDGWPVATLDTVGIDRPAIERFVQMLIDTPMDSVHAQDIHGVLIARHGKLVLEEYFHGQDGTQLHDTRSAAKSMTSVLIGAAIEKGARLSPATPVYGMMGGGNFPPSLEPRKRAMTLEHLMTMSSGLHCDDSDPKAPGNEDVMQSQDAQPDWYRYALDLPMAAAPGETAIYCSTNPNLAGGVLAKATGTRLEDSFDRLIARPMQFGRYALNVQPTGQPYMGGGAQFIPRDFMKLGQMMLDGGVWHGHRIVSAAWAKRSTAPIREMRGLHYGYFWWGIDLPYRDRKLPAYYAAGNGGQVVIVVPALDLVVAIFGGNYSDKVMYVPQEIYTPQYILPAVD